MDSTHALTEVPTERPELPQANCPGCGSLWGEVAAIPVALFDGAALRRCARCGERQPVFPVDAADAPGVCGRALEGSETDNLPRLTEGGLEDPGTEAPGPVPAADRALAQATEREVCRVLAGRWRFVSAPRCSEYLDRLARAVAARIEGAPGDCRVLLFDEPSALRLALPSGRLLMSVGAVSSVEDEAELIFVLGHELTHFVSGEASRRLVALGLAGVSRNRGRRDDRAWLEAATDLIHLGYGAESEYRSDLQGLRGVLALGYDPESVFHYLKRLGERIEAGDARLAALALAHPLPADRLLRLQKTWGAHVRDPGASRVNRDSFRRAVGHSAMASALQTVQPFPQGELSGEGGRPVPWRDWRLIGTGVAILLLAAVFLLVGLLLSR